MVVSPLPRSWEWSHTVGTILIMATHVICYSYIHYTSALRGQIIILCNSMHNVPIESSVLFIFLLVSSEQDNPHGLFMLLVILQL